MLQKIQKIGNVILLIAMVAAIIWMRYDYQNKINADQAFYEKQMQGIQYSITDSNERNALSVKQIEDKVNVLGSDIISLKSFVEQKLKK